jgi:thiamine-phosphate pyrophosphorylase
MTPPYDAAQALARQALRVRGSDPAACPSLPPLLALSDPARTPDLAGLVEALPPGSGLVYRHFGAPDRADLARALSGACQARGIMLLVSADPDLDRLDTVDGIHWPETWLHHAAAARARGDRRLFTAAAHSPRAVWRARQAGIDAVLLSPVFPSRSPSAGRAKGVFAAAAVTRTAGMPVYALGGVDIRSSRRLEGLGFSGIACVGAIRSAGPTRT